MIRSGAHPAARRGFLLLDMMAGLLIVVALTFGLMLAVSRQSRAAMRMNQSRAALAAAERVMAALRVGSVYGPGEGFTVEIERLDTPAPTDRRVWARVTVRNGRGAAELTGLVPRGAGEGAR